MDDSVMPTTSREKQRKRSERYRKDKQAMAESSTPGSPGSWEQTVKSGHAAIAQMERECVRPEEYT